MKRQSKLVIKESGSEFSSLSNTVSPEEKLRQDMENKVTCLVWKDIMTPTNHTMCPHCSISGCKEWMIKSVRAQRKCPNCRKQVSLNALKPNSLMDLLIQQYFNSCGKIKCKLHKFDATLYCRKWEEVICATWVLAHKDCLEEIVEVKAEVKKVKEKLVAAEKLLFASKEYLKDCIKLLEMLQELEDKAEKNVNKKLLDFLGQKYNGQDSSIQPFKIPKEALTKVNDLLDKLSECLKSTNDLSKFEESISLLKVTEKKPYYCEPDQIYQMCIENIANFGATKPLKHNLTIDWSMRVNDELRLNYQFVGENKKTLVIKSNQDIGIVILLKEYYDLFDSKFNNKIQLYFMVLFTIETREKWEKRVYFSKAVDRRKEVHKLIKILNPRLQRDLFSDFSNNPEAKVTLEATVFAYSEDLAKSLHLDKVYSHVKSSSKSNLPSPISYKNLS